jgi:prepilin-type N-terminal cleavage/methylation domain-containing protein
MSTPSDLGFSLLEMLVVIVLTALLLTVVLVSPLNHFAQQESPHETAVAFSNWMQQQQNSSAWSSEPLRMCLIERHIQLMRFKDKRWQNDNAFFAIPSAISVTVETTDPDIIQKTSPPCFNFTPSGITPAGSFVFGRGTAEKVAWGDGQ